MLEGTKKAARRRTFFPFWPVFCFIPQSTACAAVAEAEEAKEKQKSWVGWKTLPAAHLLFTHIAVI